MPWHEESHYQFSEGIYRTTSTIDPKFPAGALHTATNMVYYRESDNPQTMRGATRLGAVNALGGVVTGLFDYNNGDKLLGTSSDGKIYQYGTSWAVSSGARATGNSTTATARWSGTMFFGASQAKNLLILCNGINAPVMYDTTSGAVNLAGSPPATGNFPVVWQGRVWMASGSTLFASKPDDAEDWSVGGGGFSINVARGHDGDITGLFPFGNNLFVFKRSTTYRIAPTASFTVVNVKNVSSTVGCVSHRTIKEIGPEGGSYLTFMSEHGIAAAVPVVSAIGFEAKNISRSIKPILDKKNTARLDVAWGIANLDRLEYSAYYPTASATTPSEGVIGNWARPRKPPRWTTHNKTNLTAGVIFVENNTDYNQYVGNNSGSVYKMHVTSASDWDGAAISGIIHTKHFTQGRPNHMKKYGWVFAAVQTEAEYDVVVRLNLLRRGLPQHSGNRSSLTITGGGGGWGVGGWGVEQWGGQGHAGERIRLASACRGNGLRILVESKRWFVLQGLTIGSSMRSDRIAA